MASKTSPAIPSHLKFGNGNVDGEFRGKHHGKSQSHVVSITLLPSTKPELPSSIRPSSTPHSTAPRMALESPPLSRFPSMAAIFVAALFIYVPIP